VARSHDLQNFNNKLILYFFVNFLKIDLLTWLQYNLLSHDSTQPPIPKIVQILHALGDFEILTGSVSEFLVI